MEENPSFKKEINYEGESEVLQDFGNMKHNSVDQNAFC